MYLDPLHATAGGLGHQDVTTKVCQSRHHLFDKALHGVGVVRRALGLDQAQAITVFAQVDRRARNAQARFQLRADGAEIKVFREHLGAVAGMLMAAIMANFLAQQAGADSDGDAAHVSLR